MQPGSLTSASVLLVDDHPIVRRGLVALLEPQPWVTRLFEAGTFAEATRLVVTEKPDLAVVDLGLPDGDGADLIRRIRRDLPPCGILVLTMTRDEGSVRECLEAGAAGYLLKDSASFSLVDALRTVLSGGLVLGSRVAAAALTTVHREVPAPLNLLTPREYRHLALLAGGRGVSEIADHLGVTAKTVRNQMSSIVLKLGVEDRVQAVLLFLDKGLLPE
jgi:two-component system, NarL family, nitrate/nitrite response regulator NarL